VCPYAMWMQKKKYGSYISNLFLTSSYFKIGYTRRIGMRGGSRD
jgi:hypothetical protein